MSILISVRKREAREISAADDQECIPDSAPQDLEDELSETTRQAIQEIRARIEGALCEDPEEAAPLARPLAEGDPDHPLLDRVRSGEFRR